MPCAEDQTVATSDRVLQVQAVAAQQGRVLSVSEWMAHTGLARSPLDRLPARVPDAQREALRAAQHPGRAQRVVAAAELGAIRRAGYAMTTGGADPGAWGLSAPLFGADRRAVGATTLAAPVNLTQGQEKHLADVTMVAPARISRGLALPWIPTQAKETLA